MSRILLVEDDLPLGSSLHRVLTVAAHQVVWVRSAGDAERFLSESPFDLLLLDLGLPDGSGLHVLERLRQAGEGLAVMIITARDTVDDRVHGLDMGADDYLPKPFAMEEMLSRIRALLRRQAGQASNVWTLGSLSIDVRRRRVSVSGQEVSLSVREFDILSTLAAQHGQVLTRAQIERQAGITDDLESNAVDVHICKLRKKLGNDWINTVRGVGYALECPT